jgi:hypothetical protein
MDLSEPLTTKNNKLTSLLPPFHHLKIMFQAGLLLSTGVRGKIFSAFDLSGNF